MENTMDEKIYDEIQSGANQLQHMASNECGKKIREAESYRDGYVQGIEDLLKYIRRSM